jgi:SAM-dependent methyltransferase
MLPTVRPWKGERVGLLRRRPSRRDPNGELVGPEALCVPIERASGPPLDRFCSQPHWLAISKGASDGGAHDAVPVQLAELFGEAHHRFYAQPWFLGRIRFEFLVGQGLKPGHRVLDLGCGAGRMGIWLISFLEPGRYFGIDAHLRSLVAFSAYEIRLHGLEARRPRLLHDGDFAFDHFGKRFDAVIDSTVTLHLPDAKFGAAVARLPGVLAPGGRLFAEALAPDRLARLREAGFELLDTLELERPRGFERRHHRARDVWRVLRWAG